MKRMALMLVVCAGALTAATVKGRVYDQSGAAIPQATVQLVNLVDASQIYKVASDDSGAYQIASVVAGKYEMQVLAKGFAYWRRPNMGLEANSELSINAVLRVGQVQEEITVTAEGRAAESGPAPKRIRVGGNVQALKLIDQQRPRYPEKAKAEGRQGTVTFVAVISKDGHIKDLVVMSGVDRDLVEAASTAVRNWRYQPTLLNGEPVEVSTTIDVNFTLKP